MTNRLLVVMYLFDGQKSYHMLYFKSLLLNDWPTFRIYHFLFPIWHVLKLLKTHISIEYFVIIFLSLLPLKLNTLSENGPYIWWPKKPGIVDFSGLCSNQQLSCFTLLDRASFSHNNTKIIKFGWELFILWVICYGLSFSGFAWFPEFRGTINDNFGHP